MKILWVSDPPTATSAYANQAALFLPRLRRAGYEVALLAVGGSAGSIYKTPDGISVYPTVGDPRGNDVVHLHAAHFGADVVLTLGDAHAFDPAVYGTLPWIAWAPTDFVPPTTATLRSLRAAQWVWSPSACGAEAYRRAGLSRVAHVPHGVDSSVFCPGDRTAARRTLSKHAGRDFSEKFLILSVAANKGTPSRKGFYETFAAHKMLLEHVPEAHLHLHTDPAGIAGGEDLRRIADLVKLDPSTYSFAPPYDYLTGLLGPNYLADAYHAADVLLSTSHGEGFGLPLVEAQMCGTPVVAPDNTSQAELTEPHLRVPCTPYMPFDGATLWCRPSIEKTVDRLLWVYRIALNKFNSQRGGFGDRADPRVLTDELRNRAMKYDAQTVLDNHLLPALRAIAAEIGSTR